MELDDITSRIGQNQGFLSRQNQQRVMRKEGKHGDNFLYAVFTYAGS